MSVCFLVYFKLRQTSVTFTPAFLTPPAPITRLKVIASFSLIIIVTDVCMYPWENKFSFCSCHQLSIVLHLGAGPHEIFPLPCYHVHQCCCCSSLAYASISRRMVSRRLLGILALAAFLTPLLRRFLSCRCLNCDEGCVC